MRSSFTVVAITTLVSLVALARSDATVDQGLQISPGGESTVDDEDCYARDDDFVGDNQRTGGKHDGNSASDGEPTPGGQGRTSAKTPHADVDDSDTKLIIGVSLAAVAVIGASIAALVVFCLRRRNRGTAAEDAPNDPFQATAGPGFATSSDPTLVVGTVIKVQPWAEKISSAQPYGDSTETVIERDDLYPAAWGIIIHDATSISSDAVTTPGDGFGRG
jgi:hypothetical protein